MKTPVAAQLVNALHNALLAVEHLPSRADREAVLQAAIANLNPDPELPPAA